MLINIFSAYVRTYYYYRLFARRLSATRIIVEIRNTGEAKRLKRPVLMTKQYLKN